MKAYVIVEGQTDAELLTSLFAHRPGLDIKMLPANGRSSVLSLARTLLLSKDLPVLVVVDVDDGEPDEIRGTLEQGLAQVASSRRWKCLVFDPDIETELLAFAPPVRKKASTKLQRRAQLGELLQTKDFWSKIKGLPKLNEAIVFIEQWNDRTAGFEAALS